MALETQDGVAENESEKDDSGSEADEHEKILKRSIDHLKLRIGEEGSERDLMREDVRFATLDQWPPSVRNARENDPNGPRPCLTIDKINQYIVQVSNDIRQNRPGVKVRPVGDGSDKQTAKVFQGVVRHIEDISNAFIAYETCSESTVRCGLGYWRVVTDYVADDSFDQEIYIKPIPDTFTTYLGAHSLPGGEDAKEGWIFEQIPIKDFEKQYPDAKTGGAEFDSLALPAWTSEEKITVCEYFYIEETKDTVLFLEDGTSVLSSKYDGPVGNVKDRRPTKIKSVKWCKHTAAEVLEERDWLGKYIPIIEMTGKEVMLEGKRKMWGLVRPAMDSLRAYNYWISALTEKMALSPKAPIIGAVGQFKTQEEKWKRANTENFATLQYDPIDVNGNQVPAPRRSEPTQIESAMIGLMQLHEHNVQTSLGMFKASVGEAESQQSGRAILALQRESDTGTFHFSDNLARSICYCGRILIDLIPKIYDTRRVLRIIDEDGSATTAVHNPDQQQAMLQVQDAAGNVHRIYNLGVGTYDVSVASGPSYNTKRQEAAAIFTELSKGAADPASAAVLRYLTVKNSDFTSSDEAENMLKALVPAQALQAAAQAQEGQPIPPQAQAKIQELTQLAQESHQHITQLAQENQQLKTGAQEGMAKVSADHDAKIQALSQEKAIQDEKMALERARFDFERQLAIEKAQLEADLAERKAGAEHDRKRQELAFQMETQQQQNAQEAATAILPRVEAQLNQTLQAGFQQMTDVLMQILQVSQAHFQYAQAPKQVGISQPKMDANGKLIGATITHSVGTVQ